MIVKENVTCGQCFGGALTTVWFGGALTTLWFGGALTTLLRTFLMRLTNTIVLQLDQDSSVYQGFCFAELIQLFGDGRPTQCCGNLIGDVRSTEISRELWRSFVSQFLKVTCLFLVEEGKNPPPEYYHSLSIKTLEITHTLGMLLSMEMFLYS